jgi:[ribosomal protein S5]-alanine N-acetyltransferase
LEKIFGADDLIYLRELGGEDVSKKYISWLNDTEINKYLDTRFSTHNFETVKEFVRMNKVSNNNYLLGIFIGANDLHIGNIKLGRINNHHKIADISYLIGDTAWWGKGVATRAIRLACRVGFETLDLQKLTAGVYQTNPASAIALERNGFVIEGVRRAHGLFGDQRVDLQLFGLLREEWAVHEAAMDC